MNIYLLTLKLPMKFFFSFNAFSANIIIQNYFTKFSMKTNYNSWLSVYSYAVHNSHNYYQPTMTFLLLHTTNCMNKMP